MEIDPELPADTFVGFGDRGGKDRKLYLERRRLIHCGRCRYHRGENRTWHRHRGTQHDKRTWKDFRSGMFNRIRLFGHRSFRMRLA